MYMLASFSFQILDYWRPVQLSPKDEDLLCGNAWWQANASNLKLCTNFFMRSKSDQDDEMYDKGVDLEKFKCLGLEFTPLEIKLAVDLILSLELSKSVIGTTTDYFQHNSEEIPFPRVLIVLGAYLNAMKIFCIISYTFFGYSFCCCLFGELILQK